MTKYTQKKIAVDAWQWDGTKDLSRAPDWIKEAYVEGKIQLTVGYKGKQTYMTITKRHGSLRVYAGSYIVKGIRGGVYPCKENTFLMAHEKV